MVEAEADAGVAVVDWWEFGVEEELGRPLRHSKRWPLGRRREPEEHSLDLMEQARM